MKKTLILAVAALFAIASCNSIAKTETTPTVDSTTVTVDTTVTTVDSSK